MPWIRPVPLTVPVILAVAVHSTATSVSVHNASFENPSLAAGEFTFAAGPLQFSPEQSFAIPGWGGTLGYAPQGAIIVTSGVRHGTNAVDGQQTLFLRAQENIPGYLGTIWQDVGEVLPNTTYTLTVAAGGRLNGVADGATGIIALMLNGWEGTPLASTAFTSIGDMHGLRDYAVTCTTGPSAAGRLYIALSIAAPAGSYPYEVNFDNVRLDANPRPALTVSNSSEGITLTVNPATTNYLVEASHDLSPNASWLALTNLAEVGTNQFTLPYSADASAFYRLRRR